MTAARTRQRKGKKAAASVLVEGAQKRLGKGQDDILFAIEAMRTARTARPPVRYRVSRLIYRGT